MRSAAEAIEDTLESIKNALKVLSRCRNVQVRGVDEKSMLAATAQAWFHTLRLPIVEHIGAIEVLPIDECFTKILDSSDRHAAKTTYQNSLRSAQGHLKKVRAVVLTAPSVTEPTDDLPPEFSPLAGNEEIRGVLVRRWHECIKCVNAEAHLAAIVMMGGLLEALFVARAECSDKSALSKSKHAPVDRDTGKPMPYQTWMLDTYIKVGCEQKWISPLAKDVANILKEYRNYVHPAKELRHGLSLQNNDSSMLWQVTKALSRQLLVSVG